ncbi:MAG: KGK domain-containing protein, partial [Spirulina sp.]
MEKQFEPLDRGEVLSVEESVQILIGHSTFRVDELAHALKAQLLEYNIGGLTEEKSGWFTAEGAECQVLRYGAGNWQKGKVRISFEFCPTLDSEIPIAARAAAISPPETTVPTESMALKEEVAPIEERLPEEAIVADEGEALLESVELPPTESFAAETAVMEAGIEAEEELLESVGFANGDREEGLDAIADSEELLISAEELAKESAMDELAGMEEETPPLSEEVEAEDMWVEKEELSELAGSSLVEAETEKLWFDEEEDKGKIQKTEREEDREELDVGEGLVEDIFDEAPDGSPFVEEREELDVGEGLVEDIFDEAPDDSPFGEEREELDADGGLVEDIFDEVPESSPFGEDSEELDADSGLVEDIFDEVPESSPFGEESEELDADGGLVEDIFEDVSISDEVEGEDVDIFAEASATTPTT